MKKNVTVTAHKNRPRVLDIIIHSRGQLTIPKQIRQVGHLEEGQIVSIIPVGDSIIITPKQLELDEARRQIRKILKTPAFLLRKCCLASKKKEHLCIRKRMTKKEVKVFLDSNVIISGLISDRGAPRVNLDILSLELPFIVGVTGRYNIIEIERNLKRKVPRILPFYKKLFSKLNLIIVPIPSLKEVIKYAGHLADKDIPVLVSAIKADTDFLITGDKKDFDRLKIKGSYLLKIVSPAEFIDVILSAILKDREK